MRKYFSKYYNKISYPIDSSKNKGLRNAQIGAIHAIASFFTINQSSNILQDLSLIESGRSSLDQKIMSSFSVNMDLIHGIEKIHEIC